MSYVIAVAGKGGVGKTTFSGMLVQHLCETGKQPILAVDADANSNLNEVLGLEIQGSLGNIREGMEDLLKGQQAKKVSAYMQDKMDKAITKGNGFDLLVMGRSQGKGCYCSVNRKLSLQMQSISENYPYILVDNEAGMEHISRGILPSVDVILLVSDCSRRGIQAAGRIKELVVEYGYTPDVVGLVVNMVPNGVLDEGTAEEIENQRLTLMGIIPHDPQLYDFDCDGEPLVNLPETSPVKSALNDIFKQIAL